jgi:hypothetical protein
MLGHDNVILIARGFQTHACFENRLRNFRTAKVDDGP